MTWFDLRYLFRTVGERFKHRIQLYFTFLTACLVLIWNCFSIRLLQDGLASFNEVQALLMFYGALLTIFVFLTLYEGAFINDETKKQIA